MKHFILFIFLFLIASGSLAAEEEPPTLTYDIGGSSGNSNGTSFAEAQLGVNYFILPWLKWRNAPFYRFRGTQPSAYGLDSSLLGTTSLALAENFSIHLGLGGGYRWINTGRSAPFAEGSLGLNSGGFRIQGSVKRVFNASIRPGTKDDNIFTITFGGSGVLY